MHLEAEKDLLKLNSGRARRPAAHGKAAKKPRLSYRRLVLWASLCLVLAGIAFYGLTWALEPHCEAWLIARDVPELKAQRIEASRNRQDLEWQIRFARSPAGSRSLARDYGYLEKGEVPIVVPGHNKLAEQFTSPVHIRTSLWDRVMLLMCRICRAGPDVVDQPQDGG